MSNGSRHRLSRGDRRRNEKLARLRAIITRETAVLAFDLAADQQVCALTDPDSKVLARRTVRVKAWQLSDAVGGGLARAAEAGFTSVVVACEPTGHRWRCSTRSPPSMASGWCACSRCWCAGPGGRGLHPQQERRHRRDDHRPVGDRAALLPARAGRPDLGPVATPRARRAGLVTHAGAARQQVRDLLECAWPAALSAAAKPLDSTSWLAAVTVTLDRVGSSGDLSVIRRWGWRNFAAAVRRELGGR